MVSIERIPDYRLQIPNCKLKTLPPSEKVRHKGAEFAKDLRAPHRAGRECLSLAHHTFSALRSLRLCGESSFVLPERYAHKIEKGENRPHPFLDIIALFARRQC
jgi:hypothetical protein